MKKWFKHIWEAMVERKPNFIDQGIFWVNFYIALNREREREKRKISFDRGMFWIKHDNFKTALNKKKERKKCSN